MELGKAESSGLSVWDIWDAVIAGRWWVIGVTAVFSLAGISYALLAQPWYRAEVVLVASDKKSLPGALGQLGGLASLAGVNLANSGNQEPLAVLRSKGFAREFIADQGLMPALLQGMDAGDAPPDIRDAVRRFDRLRSVSEDIKTGVVTLGIRWKDPTVASQWANSYVKGVNNRLRTQALLEAQRNVDFLQKEIAATGVVSLQTSMGRVLEGEMQKLMLARGNDEFAFKIIDSATPPKFRESPKRTLVVVAATLAGVLVSMLILLARNALRDRKVRRAPAV
jgi:uncharacterized protein involved in exopolysaccharide biosynthesis